MIRTPVRPWMAAMLLCCLAIAACEGVSTESILSRAEIAMSKSDYRAAILDLKTLLQQKPDNARARWLLAEIYLIAEDGAAAEKELERARSLGVGEDAAIPALARALFLQGEYDKVLLLTTEDLSSREAIADLLAYQAQSHLSKGDVDAARETMRRAEVADGLSVHVRFANARLLAFDPDSDPALAALEKLNKDFPNYATAWSLRGDILGAKQQYAAAEEAYAKALGLRMNPTLDTVKRGFARYAQGNLEGARKDATLLRTGAPNYHLGHYLAGLVEYKAGRLAQAQDALARAYELDPQHFQTVFLLGLVDTMLGNSDNRARLLAERAVILAPGFVSARKFAALWYLRDKKMSEAASMLGPVVRSDPSDSDAKALLASILIAQGSLEEAGVLLSEVAAQQTDSVEKKVRTGLGLLLTGRNQLGMEVLGQAHSEAPVDLGPASALVAGLLREQAAGEALKIAKRFADERDNDPVALNLMAGVQEATGDRPGAVASYKLSLAKDSRNILALRALARLALGDEDPAAAFSYTEAGLGMAPDDLPLLLLQASSAKQAGNTELYKTALQRAISSHPGAPGPRALMARQVLERNDPEKALAILAELPETEHSGVLASRAEAYFRLNRLSESRRDLEALARLFQNSIDIQVQLARIYDATGDKTSLNASLNRIRELAPNDKRAVLAKAQLDIASGRPEDARSLLESNGLQPADDPLVLEVWMGLARSEKDRAGEIAYARRLAELQPTSRRVLLLNRAQQRAGAQDEAKRVLLEWLDRHPDDVSILAELANLYIGTGEIDKSIEQLRRINSLDANNAYALNNLAWYLRKTSPTEAKEFAERAIETAPDESIVVDTYAVVLSEQRNYDQALRVLQSAIDRGGQVAALRLRRAEILRLKGDLDGAVKELETLMESAPPPAVRERAKKQLVELALPPN